MDSRKVKQIIYGGGFLAFIFAVLAGGYFLFVKPAPTCFDNKQNGGETGIDCGGSCAPCQNKNAKPIVFNWIRNFSSMDGKIVITSEIKNPNDNVGASDFAYEFSIYNKNSEKIKTVFGHSFIYPSEVRYLIEAVTGIDDSEIAGINLDFSEYNWVSAENFKEPQIQLKRSITKIYDPKQNLIPLYSFSRTLSQGFSGEDVKLLEDFLIYKGYFKNSSDNNFDSETKKSLAKYQADNNLSPASGDFDVSTLNFVNADIAKIRKQITESQNIYFLTIEGTVKNIDTVNVSKAVINGFVYNKLGGLIAFSKTEIENLNPGDEKDFRIIFPRDIIVSNIDPDQTKIYIDSIR